MTLQIVFCIAIFLYMIVMLAWNKYPMGVTALYLNGTADFV